MRTKKPLWRRILRGVGIALSSLVVLAALAVAFLHTPWGKRIVKSRIEAKLAAKVNGTVKLGSLDYTFLFGELALRDLAIDDAHGRPALRIAAIDIDLDRSSVLAKEPLLESLAVRGLDVHSAQLEGLFKPSKDKPSLARLRVAKLSVDGKATIAKPDGTVITVDDLRLAGSLDARIAAKQTDASLALGAHVTIAKPGKPAKQLDVAIDALSLSRRTDGVDVKLAQVAAGPLSIDSLVAHAELANGKLAGPQLVTLQQARIDRTKLAALLGRELLRDDVLFDITIDGPASALVLDGSIRTGATTLSLDGTADMVAARPTYKLALVGDELRTQAIVSKQQLPAVSSDVRIELAGSGTSLAQLDANLDVAIHALGIDVKSKAHIAAKTLDATLTLGAKPADVLAQIEAAGVKLPAKVQAKLAALRSQLPPSLDVAVTANGRVDGALDITLAPLKLALAKGSLSVHGDAQLANKKLTTATAQIKLTSLDLASLAQLAGKQPKLHGSLSGNVALSRDGAAKRASYDLSIALAKPALTVGVRGATDLAQASVHATIKQRATVIATADAQLPLGKQHGKLGLRANGAMKVAVDLVKRPAAELASLLPERLRAKLPKGDVELHLALAGTPAQPTGTLALAATDAGKHVALHGTLSSSASGMKLALKGGVALPKSQTAFATPALSRSPLASTVHGASLAASSSSSRGASLAASSSPVRGASLAASSSSSSRSASLAASSSSPVRGASSSRMSPSPVLGFLDIKPTRDSLAAIDATISMPSPFATGKLDVKAVRAGATVDATIDLPARPLSSLGALRPKLAQLGTKLGGKLDGRITAHGALKTPALDAKLRWFDYRTAAGTTGETLITAYGTPTQLTAKIDHQALAIVARIDRRDAQRIAVHASAHAVESPLLPLLPAFLAQKLGAHEPGRVRSNLDGTFALVKTSHGLSLDAVDVSGSLDITGASFAIPKSGRRYKDIGLSLAADPKGLRITSRAHESDAENANRKLAIDGLLAFANQKPAKLDLSLVADDWLLFGSSPSSKLGLPDAPRAAADFKLGVAVDLTQPTIAVDATVHSLALRAPERFDRGHQPEIHSDDIIYLERGAKAGALPVAKLAPPAQAKQRRPIDIRVHIPKPIRLNQTPFDVMATGELTVTVRDAGVKTRGALTMHEGTLFLFGHDHELISGSLSFTDEHPQGWLALTFERPLPDAVMRELSKSSANGGLRVAFAGAPTKPKTSLSGAANSALAEVMSINNAGRGVYVTRPGLPASSSVQAPRGDQLQVLTFLASNLPHLLFLDRISAWSDPYASANAYGRIQHVEAERYTKGDKARIRAVVRPNAPGRSSAEVQYDRMLISNDRAAAGVGVRAGDRGGGGVGLFFEWSSED